MARLDENLRRELSFDKGNLDEKERTVELSFSSEMPVSRGDFDEVLSHNPDDCDLSRLNNSHPLLLNHDPEKQIGVVERARLCEDKKGRAIVRFSRSQLGEEIMRDVADGIRRLVSVGYKRTKELDSEKNGNRDVVRFAWQPYEISLVSVPADASVGVGRQVEPEAKIEEPKVMAEIETKQTVDPVAEERKRIAEIRACTKNLRNKIPDIDQLAERAESEGWSLDQYRAEFVKHIPDPVAAKPAVLGVTEREIKGYSIARAFATAGTSKWGGIEKELSDEYASRFGSPKNMFWLPYEALSVRSLAGQGVATASLGGNLKATELLSAEFITLLKNRMLIAQLGARQLSGLSSDIDIPRAYHATVASWRTEVEAAVASDYGIQKLSLAPKGCTAKTAYSKQLLIQGNPSIDMLLRDDMIQQIALAIDLAALHGGGSSEPTGIYSTTGVNLVTLSSNGAAFDTLGLTAVASIVSLETSIAVSNADVANMAFVTNAKVRGALRAAPVNTNAETFVWSNSSTPGVGSLLGYSAYVSNQVYSDRTVGSHTTCSSIFFGDWSQVIMATWGGGLDILVDPYSSAGTRETLIYATQYADVGLRHPESFAVLKGVAAG